MTLIQKTARLVLPAALMLSALAAPAAAQTATFKYKSGEAPADIYARFQKTAKAQCQKHIRAEGPMSLNTRINRVALCQDDLLTQAVEQTRIPALAAIHSGDDAHRSAAKLAQRASSASE